MRCSPNTIRVAIRLRWRNTAAFWLRMWPCGIQKWTHPFQPPSIYLSRCWKSMSLPRAGHCRWSPSTSPCHPPPGHTSGSHQERCSPPPHVARGGTRAGHRVRFAEASCARDCVEHGVSAEISGETGGYPIHPSWTQRHEYTIILNYLTNTETELLK